MTDRDEDGKETMGLPWPTVQKVLYAIMVLGFGMALVGLIGTILGWFSPPGDVLMIVGTVMGALAGMASLIGSTTRDQAETVVEGVDASNRKLDDIGDSLESQTNLLVDIRDRL